MAFKVDLLSLPSYHQLNLEILEVVQFLYSSIECRTVEDTYIGL